MPVLLMTVLLMTVLLTSAARQRANLGRLPEHFFRRLSPRAESDWRRQPRRPSWGPDAVPAYPTERSCGALSGRMGPGRSGKFFRHPQAGCSRARVETLFGRGGRYRLRAEGLP